MSTEDKKMILTMLQDGKIGVEEGEKLLSALNPKAAEAPPPPKSEGNVFDKFMGQVQQGVSSAKENVENMMKTGKKDAANISDKIGSVVGSVVDNIGDMLNSVTAKADEVMSGLRAEGEKFTFS